MSLGSLEPQYLHLSSINSSNFPYMVLVGTTGPNLCKVLSIVPGTEQVLNKCLAFSPSNSPPQL